MQWIKGVVGLKDGNSISEQAGNSIVGSDNWLGREDGNNSYALSPHSQYPTNPMLEKNAEDRNNTGMRSLAVTDDGKVGGNVVSSESVQTVEEILVTIPGSMVHLIDDQESQYLASGEFSLVRLIQEGTGVVVLIKVGTELKWPLVQEEPTVKLDPTHYYFSLKPPYEDGSLTSTTQEDTHDNVTLNYGVTFPADIVDDHSGKLADLDKYLERYSSFSAPTVVKGDGVDMEKIENVAEDPKLRGKVIPVEVIASSEKELSQDTTAAFWTSMAPNVEDYNSSPARAIAIGGGHIIRGIFWCSDSTVSYLAKGGSQVKNRLKPGSTPAKISPSMKRSMRSARKLSAMTDKVASGVLGGIVYTTGLFSSAVITSKPGKYLFKLLPGEVALVSLDAFGRVFDAVEKAGQDIMQTSSSVAQDLVNHRYGESAAELTNDAMKTGGHLAATAWTVTKLRRALNPKSSTKFISKTAFLKSAAKATAADMKAGK